MICFHDFVSGFGGMGDSVVCKKCGLDRYPEYVFLLPLYRRFGRVNMHPTKRDIGEAKQARILRGRRAK